MDIIAEINTLKIGHYYCEDRWYSCPMAEGGCADNTIPKNECTCNAEDHNKKVDSIIAHLSLHGYQQNKGGKK